MMSDHDDYFELLFQLSPDVIYSISTADGTFARLNPAFETVTGYKIKDWLGRPFAELVHEEDVPLARERFMQHMRGVVDNAPFRLRIRHASGHYLIGEFSSASLRRGGRVEEVIGIARDITSRVETNKKLERADKLLQDLLRQSHSD